MREPARYGVAAVVAVVVIWGTGGVLAKSVTAPGLALAFWRLWLAVPIMFVLLAVLGRRLTPSALRTAAPGGVLFGLHMALFFSSLQLTSVAIVTVIAALQPALVLLVAGRMFGERVSRRDIASTVVAIVGVSLVVLGSPGSVETSALGTVLSVLNVFAFTAYFLVSKRTRSSLDALEYLTGAVVVAALVVTPVALLSNVDLGAVGGTDWAWIAVIVVLPGATGHGVMNWAHRYVDVSVSSLLMLAGPVVSAVAAWLALDERLTIVQVLGAGVVVASLAVIVRSSPEPVEVAPAVDRGAQ